MNGEEASRFDGALTGRCGRMKSEHMTPVVRRVLNSKRDNRNISKYVI
jgi:hypothetical protein